jgi:hypothetical protein
MAKKYTRNVLDMDCQTQGRLKLMIELYISEICHKFSNNLIGAPSYFCCCHVGISHWLFDSY